MSLTSFLRGLADALVERPAALTAFGAYPEVRFPHASQEATPSRSLGDNWHRIKSRLVPAYASDVLKADESVLVEQAWSEFESELDDLYKRMGPPPGYPGEPRD